MTLDDSRLPFRVMAQIWKTNADADDSRKAKVSMQINLHADAETPTKKERDVISC